MATTSGPLLSFDARQSLGKTIVYSSWKGISYARRWVQPANPKTAAQTDTRNTFKWLMAVWTYMPALVQESWNAYAEGQPMTGRNALAKFNVAQLKNDADLTDFLFAPSAKSGPIDGGVVVTPGAGQLSIAITAPTLPVGWTIVAGRAAVVRQQDPQTGVLYTVTAGEDLTAAYAVVLTGLTAAVVYRVGAWFKYQKPDLSFAYGRATMTVGTPA
jgi:hypothetical protein